MERRLEHYGEILEAELEEAVEIKNRQALHRFAVLLTDGMVAQRDYDRESRGIRADLRLLNETMKLGFADVNRRFDAANRRIAMMFTFITIGLTVLGLAIVLAR